MTSVLITNAPQALFGRSLDLYRLREGRLGQSPHLHHGTNSTELISGVTVCTIAGIFQRRPLTLCRAFLGRTLEATYTKSA